MLNKNNIFFNELFLDKVFVENDKSKIIDLMKSLKKEDFSSETHYTIYKMFILPKLRMVGKEYEKTVVGRRYRYRYRYRYKLVITISQSYIILDFFYCKDNYSCHSTAQYIIGKDNDKIFVNQTDIPINVLCNYDIDINDVVVCKADDRDIKRYLEFEHEFNSEENVIVEKGRYRVQGEIVLDVIDIDTDFKNYVIERLNRQIEEYATLLFSDFLIRIIQDIGFDIDIRRGIAIPDVLRHNKLEEDSYYISKALFNELRKHFDYAYIEHGELDHFIELSNEYYGNITILVRAFQPLYGFKYSDLGINPEIRPGECGQVCSEIKRELEDQIDMIQPINTNMAIGNHYIQLKNVIPMNIEYTPSIKPLNVAEMTLLLRQDNYYVDEKSEVTLTHREHGTTIVRFSKPFLIRLTTTRTHHAFTRIWNRAMLRIIKNMYKKQKH